MPVTYAQHQRNLFYALFIGLGVVVFLMLRSYVATLIGAVLLAYIFYRPYEWLVPKVRRKGFAAGIILVLIVLLVTLPTFLIGNLMYREAMNVLSNPKIIEIGQCVGDSDIGCQAISELQERFPHINIQGEIRNLAGVLTNWLKSALSEVVDITIKMLIMLFVIFYLLIDGRQIVAHLARLLTIKKPHAENLMKTMKDTMNAVVYGQIVAALAQGAVAALGFWLIAGIQNPLLWGLITAFISLLPVLGAGLVWAPVSLYLFISGIVVSETGLIARGIVLGVYGIAVISTVDNLIKTKLISTHAKIHQIVAFIGVFGGLSLFGFVGIFIGPVILALFVNFVNIYMSEEMKDESTGQGP